MNAKNNWLPNQHLALTGFVEPVKVGEPFYDFPPHVTVLPPFTMPPEASDEFDKAVKHEAGAFHHLELTGTEVVNFGAAGEVPACKVESEGLVTIHNDLLGTLKQLGGVLVYPPDWVGDNFNPHISDTKEHYVEPGDVLTLSGLYLVAKSITPNKKGEHHMKAIRYYPFRGA